MTTNEKKYFKKGYNHYPKVCRTPAFILKIKGKCDSRKGEGVCNEYIKRLLKKEAFLETGECLDAEKILKEIREKGAGIVVRLSADKGIISSAANSSFGSSPDEIRKGRRNSIALNNAGGAAKASVTELAEIKETITSVHTILEERIEKIRNHTMEKIHIYISGVRAGKLCDYEGNDVVFSDKALDIYLTKHAELDDKIADIVSNSMKEA